MHRKIERNDDFTDFYEIKGKKKSVRTLITPIRRVTDTGTPTTRFHVEF